MRFMLIKCVKYGANKRSGGMLMRCNGKPTKYYLQFFFHRQPFRATTAAFVGSQISYAHTHKPPFVWLIIKSIFLFHQSMVYIIFFSVPRKGSGKILYRVNCDLSPLFSLVRRSSLKCVALLHFFFGSMQMRLSVSLEILIFVKGNETPTTYPFLATPLKGYLYATWTSCFSFVNLKLY